MPCCQRDCSRCRPGVLCGPFITGRCPSTALENGPPIMPGTLPLRMSVSVILPLPPFAADGEHIAEHTPGITQHVDLALRVEIPRDGHFEDRVASAACRLLPL